MRGACWRSWVKIALAGAVASLLFDATILVNKAEASCRSRHSRCYYPRYYNSYSYFIDYPYVDYSWKYGLNNHFNQQYYYNRNYIWPNNGGSYYYANPVNYGGYNQGGYNSGWGAGDFGRAWWNPLSYFGHSGSRWKYGGLTWRNGKLYEIRKYWTRWGWKSYRYRIYFNSHGISGHRFASQSAIKQALWSRYNRGGWLGRWHKQYIGLYYWDGGGSNHRYSYSSGSRSNCGPTG